MKRVLFLIVVAAILLFSCDFIFEPASESESESETNSSSTSKKFWAQDLSKDYTDPKYFYQLNASLLEENDYCKVWAETTSGVSKSTAQDVAAAFSDIYAKMLSTFGMNFRVDNSGKIYNTIELADYIGDGDGKLCILLLDIKDGYKPGVNDAAVGGYFFSGDLLNYQNSNLCDMIYIDTYPGYPGREESNLTLAHELQHLMNDVTSKALRNDGTYYYPMDLWINEGLSSAAEWAYLRKHPLTRWGWYYYNGDGYGINGLIDKGNNFFVWGNREKENQYAVLDDYATVYLFFQWLRIQYGGDNEGSSIYRDIISSDYSDYRAVTEAAAKIYSPYSYWETLLGDWLAANYDTGSLYSYGDDPELSLIKMHLLSTNEPAVSLYPGEGVFSRIVNNYTHYETYPYAAPPSSSPNIRYRVFEADPDATNHQGTLLTFNANIANSDKEKPESGVITGVVVPPEENAAASVQWRAARRPANRPYWVGADDIRRGEAASPTRAVIPLLRSYFAVGE